jgi:hypothetical protein
LSQFRTNFEKECYLSTPFVFVVVLLLLLFLLLSLPAAAPLLVLLTALEPAGRIRTVRLIVSKPLASW